jgi:hypothetical protein
MLMALLFLPVHAWKDAGQQVVCVCVQVQPHDRSGEVACFVPKRNGHHTGTSHTSRRRWNNWAGAKDGFPANHLTSNLQEKHGRFCRFAYI